jgi:hypothetical protein
MPRLVFRTTLSVIALFAGLFALSCTRSANHEKITVLVTELSSNQYTKEDVRALVGQPRFDELALHQESPNEWSVEAPMQFGAKNWILYIEFRDSKITGLRVRTANSKNEHPTNAPEDKYF